MTELNNNNNNNLNNNIFEIFSECSILISLADDIFNSVENATKENNINSIDINSAEQQLNLALDNYNKSIQILNQVNQTNDIQQEDREDIVNYKNEIINSLYLLNLKKNKTVELKSRILASNISEKESKVVLTLSQCIVYRWEEDSNSNNSSNNSINSNQIIEKEILGQGKFILSKLKEDNTLHSIKIKFEDSDKSGEQLFIVTPETGILVYQRGHYVLQVGSYFYGLILPENIPAPYIDVLERILVTISYFVALPPPSEEQQLVTTTTTTTSTTTTTTSTELIKANDKPVGFVVSSLKSGSNVVNSGSESIVNGILTASAMISIGLRSGGFILKSKLDKNEEPTQVSPFVVKSVDAIKVVTPYAKQGSAIFINSVSSVIAGVGNGIISGVKYFIPENENGEKENETFNAAVDFGKQSFKSISSIVGAFGDGVSQIYEETTSTTVDVLNHKYGEHVAKVTDKTFSATKDIFDTTMNIRGLGLNIAKTSTKEIVQTSFIKNSSATTISTTTNKTLLLKDDGNLELNEIIKIDQLNYNNLDKITLEKSSDQLNEQQVEQTEQQDEQNQDGQNQDGQNQDGQNQDD